VRNAERLFLARLGSKPRTTGSTSSGIVKSVTTVSNAPRFTPKVENELLLEAVEVALTYASYGLTSARLLRWLAPAFRYLRLKMLVQTSAELVRYPF
jgi:hypothetical protein